jgi:hypothetical protein
VCALVWPMATEPGIPGSVVIYALVWSVVSS